MCDGSRKSDLLHLGVLTGLCLLIGVFLIHQTVLITRDGVLYIRQAQQLAGDSVGVARRYPVGFPFLLWAAHEAATLVAGHDSAMLWVQAAQGVTLLCRVLALIPLYFLGKLLVGARNSFWALLVLIILPYPARYGSDVVREWPYLLFLGLGFWLLYRGLRRRQWWVLALVGLDAGLGFTIRPECAQLVLYGLLGLVFVPFGDCSAGKMPAGRKGGTPSPRGVRKRTLAGAGLLLIAGFLLPIAPYVYATGTVVPHQLRPSFNTPPVVSAVGSQAASDDPLEFEVSEGELLELPIQAADSEGDPLLFSVVGVPVGSRPVYEFRSPRVGTCLWTTAEYEKDLLLSMYSRQVWDYEGIACYAYAQADACPGLQGVYRFWSPARLRHLYTMDERERDSILKGAAQDPWTSEGVVFYVFAPDSHPPDTAPVYRFEDREHGSWWAVKDPAADQAGPEDDVPQGTVAWYVHLAGEPPAGAGIEGGIFRWRPRPGQKGDYQINIIISDGKLQSCQLVRIRVTALQDRTTEGGGPAEAAGSGLPHRSVLQHAGLKTLPPAAHEFFDGLVNDLMAVFLVPWFVGSYVRFRRHADRLERVLIPAVVIVNVVLVLGRHIGVGAGEDRRYSLGLIALTIFYIPVGVDIMAGWADRIHAFWRPRWMTRILPHAFWFGLLMAIGITVCLPKLLMSGRTDKTGYRAAAEWLRQNTKPEDVLAVPDNRLSFYAERPGLLYIGYPDPRKADYVVAIEGERETPAPDTWRREYSVAVHRRSREAVVIYRTARRKP